MDICKLGKTDVILGMPWLAAHNPEINWETEEVKMTRCPPLCGKKFKRKEIKKRQTTEEDQKDLRWTMEKKEKEEEMKEGGGAGTKTIPQMEEGIWES